MTLNQFIQATKQGFDRKYRFQPVPDLDNEYAEILVFSDASLANVFNQSGEKARISVDTSSR